MNWTTTTLFEALYNDIPCKWSDFLMRDNIRTHIADISTVLERDATNGERICPQNICDTFRIFYEVIPTYIKCVVIGIEPYRIPYDAATGIAFSIPTTYKNINPSQMNILKACNRKPTQGGCLDNWGTNPSIHTKPIS